MKLRHQMRLRQYLMRPGTGCVIMATEVNFSDSEPIVVVLVTPFWGRSKACENADRLGRIGLPTVLLEVKEEVWKACCLDSNGLHCWCILCRMQSAGGAGTEGTVTDGRL